MVLTTIVSEAVDLGYHIMRLGLSGVRYGYYWYYGIEEITAEKITQMQTEETNKTLREIKDMVMLLQSKVETLEKAK